jgi:sigma-54 specific flagellar transcriptional regulator A
LLQFYAEKHVLPGARALKFSADMLKMLKAYAWPGNVRELSNLVDRFSTLFPSQTLQVHTVPACMMPSGLAALQALHISQSPPAVEAVPSVCAPEQEPSNSPWAEEDPLHQLLMVDVPAQSEPLLQAFKPVPLSASNDEMTAVEEVILLAQGIQSLPPDGISLKQHLVDIERSLIEQALSRTQGNVSQTARLLQLQRTTLIEKINKYDLRAVG